jgi:hypothetical protein
VQGFVGGSDDGADGSHEGGDENEDEEEAATSSTTAPHPAPQGSAAALTAAKVYIKHRYGQHPTATTSFNATLSNDDAENNNAQRTPPPAPFEIVFDVTLAKAGTSSSSLSSSGSGSRDSGRSAGGSGGGALGDLAGTWTDDLGKILVETDGRRITMTEVPTPRRWGTTEALLIGDTLRFADFRHLAPTQHTYTAATAAAAMTTTAAAEGGGGGGSGWGVDWGRVLRSGFSVGGGVEFNGGSSATSTMGGGGLSIEWGSSSMDSSGSSSSSSATWRKDVKPLRFRFLRLTVTATTRQVVVTVVHRGWRRRQTIVQVWKCPLLNPIFHSLPQSHIICPVFLKSRSFCLEYFLFYRTTGETMLTVMATTLAAGPGGNIWEVKHPVDNPLWMLTKSSFCCNLDLLHPTLNSL